MVVEFEKLLFFACGVSSRRNPDVATDPTTVEAGNTNNNICSAVKENQVKEMEVVKISVTTCMDKWRSQCW